MFISSPEFVIWRAINKVKMKVIVVLMTVTAFAFADVNFRRNFLVNETSFHNEYEF